MHRLYATPPLMRGGAADDGRIWLTFDDGPDPEWTPRILDMLAANDMRATFFVVGRTARAHAAIVRQIAAAGHEIGNHTWSHRHPWTLCSRVARQEVHGGSAAIADVAGRAAKYFRPPHGRLRQCMIDEAEADGQRVALWSLSAVDWGPLGHARGIAARLGKAKAGDIVLMHDGGQGINRPTELARVLPAFLEKIARERLSAGPLAE